ncbi:NAD(P)H-quinone oxidoreductase [Rhodococcus tukisamuensis]|uniref:Putative NAD(P)H quinone oxidoreductase, PIG3 family n=1 Tax=Rhodococcus tukisamuensis TaxID=168276 RepID=A0A1G6VI17_9NOCA|nr:NAD(P)H-quinone oxidoreductase [Rhodococcus tukisamuensis]SDD53188.1 putative NAD(P)H quinone oxidoreductase, PIG3 family [Rhodococcus tukisamuensis]
MRAVSIVDDGADGRLAVITTEDPQPSAGEIVIDVAGAGVNRADVTQRRGGRNVPPGASPLPGLECAGTVSAVGASVAQWKVGDRVCAIMTGGGYAEKVVVPAGQVMAVPPSVSLVDAAALPEAMATAWSNLVGLGRLTAGDRLLVHGGASGVGTMAIQLAKMLGVEVFATVGDDRKAAICRDLGARAVFNYRSEDFVERVQDETSGAGVDVVLDVVGADYLQRNVEALAFGGRLVMIGLQSGSLGALDLREVVRKQVCVTGSLLRPRSVAEKTQIVGEIATHVMPWVRDGSVVPVVDSRFTFGSAGDAHALMESSAHIGKILLVPA